MSKGELEYERSCILDRLEELAAEPFLTAAEMREEGELKSALIDIDAALDAAE